MVRYPAPNRFDPSSAPRSSAATETGHNGFPVTLLSRDRPALIVGDTPAAEAKARLVAEAGLTVVRHAGTAAGHAETPDLADLQQAAFIVIATGDAGRDATLAARARAVGLPVNVVDRPALSDFTVPAIVRRGPLTVAIASGGLSPVLAARLRQTIESLLPDRLGGLALFAGRFARAVRARLDEAGDRRRFWTRFFDGPGGRHVLSGRIAAAEGVLQAQFAALDAEEAAGPARGAVFLVGAGPGDPDLLTLKALQLLQSADVIVHDRLVPEAILARARQDAERIPVGKVPGGPGWRQTEINALLLRLAGEGRRVVRLKGGDPAVFSRGGEEAEALRAAGFECTLVPGVTAASAAAASAGVTLTRRGAAQALTLVTAHPGIDEPDPDWSAYGRSGGTLAVYMGVARARETADGLQAAGRAADTPVLIVERASQPDERRLSCRLDTLAQTVRQENVRAPAMLLIGEAVATADADAEADSPISAAFEPDADPRHARVVVAA